MESFHPLQVDYLVRSKLSFANFYLIQHPEFGVNGHDNSVKVTCIDQFIVIVDFVKI